MTKLKDVKLVMTSIACPEQYDAFYKGKQVGYLRLRHGYYIVIYPNHMGKIIYEAYPKGDGMFEDSERDFYLNRARKVIINQLLLEGIIDESN